MAVTIRPVRFKATQEWEQVTRIGRKKLHFDRDFSISKKAFGFEVGNLNFNVKFKTDGSNDPYVTIKTESKEIFIDFRILIEYSAGGKSGSFTSNSIKEFLYTFTSDCPEDQIFNDVFNRTMSNVEIAPAFLSSTLADISVLLKKAGASLVNRSAPGFLSRYHW